MTFENKKPCFRAVSNSADTYPKTEEEKEFERGYRDYMKEYEKTANRFHGFPCPVLKLANRYQWRLSDIEKWVGKLPPAFDIDGRPIDQSQDVYSGAFVSSMRASL